MSLLRTQSSTSRCAPTPSLYHARPAKTRQGKQGTFVETLLQRSITGRRFDIHIHRHGYSNLHLTWNNQNIRRIDSDDDDDSLQRSNMCIERVVVWTDFFDDVIKTFFANPIEGMCTCLLLPPGAPGVVCPNLRKGRFMGYSPRQIKIFGLCTCTPRHSEPMFLLPKTKP